MSRRDVVRASAVAVTGTSMIGETVAQESPADAEIRPQFGSYLDGVDGGYDDLRGEDQVTVAVGAEGNGGNVAFSPAKIWIDSETTVVFEWTGEGGAHNVVTNQGPASLNSGSPVSEAGTTYEYTFESTGITTYFCSPHESQGMRGGVAVGSDIPTVTIEEETGVLPESAKALGVAGSAAMAGTLGLAYVFIKYGGAGRE